MAVQQEIKSQLAKLLATEDIVVEHKHCETAQFNVETRVLTLPLWEKASNYVYDMLVGHEVGHALFTPNEDPPKHVPHNFLNVCEDARIEKLMKRKYLGIAKSFYRGYNEMHKDNFFELDGEDIDNFNLADRANLHFKIGSFLPISFSDPEKEIITLIQNAETFTETIAAAEALYNFCKQEQEAQEQVRQESEGIQSELFPESASGGDSHTGDSDTDSTGDIDSSLSDSNSDAPLESGIGDTDSDTRGSDNDTSLEPTVETADALMGKLKDLTKNATSENVYVDIPKLNLESVIVSNETVHEIIDKHYKAEDERYSEAVKARAGEDVPQGLEYLYPKTTFQFPDDEYIKFKKDAQKEVSYLVKEFECRKSASAYARASTARTGVLDTRKLHTYKFNEDLFKKITVLPDGKNHGLIFILDWSGSMQYVLQDTLKQLYNLIWFCRKVQIPFDVYAFTSEYRNRVQLNRMDHYDRLKEEKIQHCERKEGFLHVEAEFNLLHFFTSDSNAKTLENQMINIWRTAYSFANRSIYGYPYELCLSGTPLNETLVTLHQLIPQFQEKTGAEKVQCIVLTDGEGSQLPYNKMVDRHWEDDEFLGCVPCHGDRSFLRDRKLGRTYKLKHGYRDFTDALLTNLKDRFSTTNFIGIRVLEGRDARYFVGHYHYNNDKIMKEWKKNKSCTITNSGYDAYFAISSTALAQDAEFDVDDEATKAQIKRAFVKSLKTKKLNKKVLGEFIELVA
ncbi:MAG: hypothetical protein CBB96_03465 [Gammaproteobacteria bacterium TMED36]|nr:MAG: hypothetical protein CBB96_03465 [Gammaproteobacteria bacterium TMED36]